MQLCKIKALKEIFSGLANREELYQKIMELANHLPPFEASWKTEANRVSGCQSEMFLHSSLKEGKIYFFAASDALISAGLASILIEIYSGEPPETILLAPPSFLEEIGIPAALSPGRANGLASLYLKMKQQALSHLAGIKL